MTPFCLPWIPGWWFQPNFLSKMFFSKWISSHFVGVKIRWWSVNWCHIFGPPILLPKKQVFTTLWDSNNFWEQTFMFVLCAVWSLHKGWWVWIDTLPLNTPGGNMYYNSWSPSPGNDFVTSLFWQQISITVYFIVLIICSSKQKLPGVLNNSHGHILVSKHFWGELIGFRWCLF